MDSCGKPRIGIFVNKQVPWSDYRVATALALSDVATFEFAFPGVCTSRIAEHFGCSRVDSGEGVHFLHDLRGVLQMWAVMRRRRYDIVHFFSTKYILVGPLVARLAGVKRIVFTVTGLGRTFSSESTTMRLLRHVYLALFRRSVKVSDAVLFQNTDDFRLFAEKCPESIGKFTVVGSSVSLERDRGGTATGEALGPRGEGEVRLLTVTRLLEEKGIREYLEVARRLGGIHGRRLRFLLIGPPSVGHGALLEEVQRADREGVIEYLGERHDVVELLQESDIFVLCSFYREGIPRVLLEAHGCGLPSVAFDIPGCRDVIIDGLTGFLVPSRDVSFMCERIEALIGDLDLRRRLGRVALTRFADEYSIERFARRMAGFYGLTPSVAEMPSRISQQAS